MLQKWFVIILFYIINSTNLIQNSPTVKVNVTEYPLIRKDETIFDVLHGVNISDPYRYLEDLKKEETKKFINQLNNFTENVLNQSKYRNIIEKQYTKYMNNERYNIFGKYGEYYYYEYNSGLQNENLIYRTKNLNDEGEMFLNINDITKNDSISRSYIKLSLDGKLMTYGLSTNGSDFVTLYFVNEKGETLPDVLKGLRIGHTNFVLNNTGFIYFSFPTKNSSQDSKTISKVQGNLFYFHKMGTQQKEDIIISDNPSDKNFRIYGYSSKDGRYLFLNLYNGSNKNHTVYYYDLYNLKGEITQKLDWKPLFDKDDAFYYIFHVDNDELYIRTNKNASMEKIFKMKFSDALKGEDSWNILVDENKNRTILSIFVVGKKYLIMDCLENVKNVFYIHDKSTGEVLQKISLEPVYTYYTFGSSESNEFFISFSNRITPGTTYRGNLDDLDKGEKVKLEIIRQKKIKNVDLNKFVLNQIFYPSKDGTNISMFLYHKKNLKLNSNNPVLLEAYGGFSLSQLPVYATYATLFVKNFNGIVCTVNVRGGGEYGERWHQDGMLHKKHNVFDDFIAGTEYLIEKNYTNPSKIAIAGASNGGLLMAVVSQRRPDLFGAVIIKYSVLDMLRFHKFNLGSGWISEYGDPDKKEDFDYLMTYSPLHNLKLPPRPVQWPSILLKTGDHDDRVDPSHTLKYVARLYEILQSAMEYQTNPILAIVTKSSGHGIIKPLSKAIADMVDVFCFMEISLNITWIE